MLAGRLVKNDRNKLCRCDEYLHSNLDLRGGRASCFIEEVNPFLPMDYFMAIVTDSIRQAAAIPVRKGRICLVSSRSGKRWVIPKGCLEPGKTTGEIALQEAWEEAGLTGVLDNQPVGSYVYEKFGSQHHVTVFLMQVTEEAEEFPERSFRERCWHTPAQALERVEDQGLREVLRVAIKERKLS